MGSKTHGKNPQSKMQFCISIYCSWGWRLQEKKIAWFLFDTVFGWRNYGKWYIQLGKKRTRKKHESPLKHRFLKGKSSFLSSGQKLSRRRKEDRGAAGWGGGLVSQLNLKRKRAAGTREKLRERNEVLYWSSESSRKSFFFSPFSCPQISSTQQLF